MDHFHVFNNIISRKSFFFYVNLHASKNQMKTNKKIEIILIHCEKLVVIRKIYPMAFGNKNRNLLNRQTFFGITRLKITLFPSQEDH